MGAYNAGDAGETNHAKADGDDDDGDVVGDVFDLCEPASATGDGRARTPARLMRRGLVRRGLTRIGGRPTACGRLPAGGVALAHRNLVTGTLTGCTTMYGVSTLVSYWQPQARAIMTELGVPLAALAGSVSCLVFGLAVAKRCRLAWILFGAASLVAAISNGIFGWAALLHMQMATLPRFSVWIFPLFGPLAICAVFALHGKVGAGMARSRVALDVALVTGSLFMLSWTITLGHDVRQASGNPARTTLRIMYPVFDIVLVSLIVAFRLRAPLGGRRSARAVFGALTMIATSDTLWTVPGRHGPSALGRLIAFGWLAGYLVLACAPWLSERIVPTERQPVTMTSTSGTGQGSAGGRVTVLATIVPYAAGAISLGALLEAGLTDRTRMDPVELLVGGAMLLALVARQAVTIADNVALTRELTAREDHFRSLVQGSSDVIMIVGDDGRVGYVSPAVRRVFGHSPDDLLGTELFALVHPEDRTEVEAELERIASEESTGRLECRWWTASPAAAAAARQDDTGWRHTESTVTRHRNGLILNIRDVTERIALQDQLTHVAYHDALTGLANRAWFADRLEAAVSEHTIGVEPVTLLFLDLDGFKSVNDTAGHAAGDALLVAAAGRLRASVRAGDTVARFGGDEFAVLLECGTPATVARDVADRLIAELGRRFHIGNRYFVVGASIGVAFSHSGITAAELMRRADIAMYRAKSAGKGRVAVYPPLPATTGDAYATVPDQVTAVLPAQQSDGIGVSES